MAIQTEFWLPMIVEKLFKSNAFLDKMKRRDENVVNGRFVHIPQSATAAIGTVVNRSTFPAVAVRRPDFDVLYAIEEFTTDPTHIPNADSIHLSFDKLQSVINEHFGTLADLVADNVLWQSLRNYGDGSALPTVLRTTGANTAAHVGTGTRKLFTADDLKRANFTMNKQNVPKSDRYALLSSDMLSQLFDDPTLKSRDGARGGEADLGAGVIDRLYGFNIMERSSVAISDNASTPVVKAIGAAAAATDNDTIVLWQRDCTHVALGSTRLFQNDNDPQFYGSIVSSLVNMGGRRERHDSRGVLAIVQAP